MGYALVLIVLAAIALLLASSPGRSQDPGSKGETPRVTQTSNAASVKRSEVRDRLLKLAKEDPPKDLSAGAMCYEMVGPPERVDYVCPVCGEKTLYAAEESGDGIRLYNNTGFLEWDLPACRRIVGQIKGVRLQLDESQFCAHCSPGVETPELVLVVYYSGEEEPHKIKGVTLQDVQLLSEFFSGQDKHTDRQDRETPLKDHLARLAELLGVELNTEN